MKKVLMILILFVVARTATAIQFEPDYWKKYHESAAKVKVYAAELNEELGSIKVPDGKSYNIYGLLVQIEVLQTYARKEFEAKSVLKGEMNKAIRANLLLSEIEKDLTLATLGFLTDGSVDAKVRSALFLKYSKAKETIRQMNQDSTDYQLKLLELL